MSITLIHTQVCTPIMYRSQVLPVILRCLILQPYKEHGTITLVIFEAATVSLHTVGEMGPDPTPCLEAGAPKAFQCRGTPLLGCRNLWSQRHAVTGVHTLDGNVVHSKSCHGHLGLETSKTRYMCACVCADAHACMCVYMYEYALHAYTYTYVRNYVYTYCIITIYTYTYAHTFQHPELLHIQYRFIPTLSFLPQSDAQQSLAAQRAIEM